MWLLIVTVIAVSETASAAQTAVMPQASQAHCERARGVYEARAKAALAMDPKLVTIVGCSRIELPINS